jgi:uncharacterized protein
MKETTYAPSPAEREAIVRAVTDRLEARPGILFAYLYGSLLGELPIHDVDVAVYVADPGADALLVLDLAADLEGALPAGLRLPVDVRLLNDAPVGYQYHVYRGRLLFCRDWERWGRLVEWATWHYLDIKPLLEQALREVAAACP